MRTRAEKAAESLGDVSYRKPVADMLLEVVHQMKDMNVTIPTVQQTATNMVYSDRFEEWIISTKAGLNEGGVLVVVALDLETALWFRERNVVAVVCDAGQRDIEQKPSSSHF